MALLARTAAFRRQAGPGTPSGVKAIKKIMHQVESGAERSGYWQACLVYAWNGKLEMDGAVQHMNDNPYALLVADARAVAARTVTPFMY